MDVFRTVFGSDSSRVTMADVLHHNNSLSTLLPCSPDTSSHSNRPRTPPWPRTSHSYPYPGRTNTLGIHSAHVSYRSVRHSSKCCMVYCRCDSQYCVLREEYPSSESVGCVVGSAEHGSRCCSVYPSTMGYLAYQSPLSPPYTPPTRICR